MNPMREIVLDKLTLNIGVGQTGEKLENAKVILNRITNTNVVVTKSNKRIPTWGVRPGLSIGVKTTLRGKEAEELLKRLIETVDYKIKKKSFDKEGNLSFGIKEYIHIPGVQYDPSLGIYGLDVCVTLKRKGGYRTKRKAYRPGKLSNTHRIKPEEAIEFFKNKFNVIVEE